MGASVKTLVEVQNGKKWGNLYENIFPVLTGDVEIYGENTSSPFQRQHYGLFAFIGGVRNYYTVPSIAPHRGLPDDHMSETEIIFGGAEVAISRYPYEILEGHSQTWVTAKELLDFNYNEKFEDRRNHDGFNSGETLPEGKGEVITYRELLGEHYFKELEVLKTFSEPNKVRIVFAFES
jgi:hypothetical protein